MRVLVTGAAGFVGRALLDRAPSQVTVIGTWRTTPLPDGVPAVPVDLRDRDATAEAITAAAPDVVVHTAYDRDGDLGTGIVATTEHVAGACADVGAALVYLSSDVVFDGEAGPYAEYDPPRPVSAYGRAKAAAEVEATLAVPDAAVVRTSLVLAAPDLDPRTAFVADALAAGEPVDLYTDEIRMPVHRDDLADGLWRLVALGGDAAAGPWHLVGPDVLSRLDLGRLVARSHGGDPGLLRGVPSPRDPDDPRPRRLVLTTARATATLGWQPRSIAAAYGVPG